jgi:hypothetical protein
MQTHLPISPNSLVELGRSHVKKFHTNISFVQHHGEINPHQLGYQGVTGWFNVTIEPEIVSTPDLCSQFLNGLFF